MGGRVVGRGGGCAWARGGAGAVEGGGEGVFVAVAVGDEVEVGAAGGVDDDGVVAGGALEAAEVGDVAAEDVAEVVEDRATDVGPGKSVKRRGFGLVEAFSSPQQSQ